MLRLFNFWNGNDVIIFAWSFEFCRREKREELDAGLDFWDLPTERFGFGICIAICTRVLWRWFLHWHWHLVQLRTAFVHSKPRPVTDRHIKTWSGNNNDDDNNKLTWNVPSFSFIQPTKPNYVQQSCIFFFFSFLLAFELATWGLALSTLVQCVPIDLVHSPCRRPSSRKARFVIPRWRQGWRFCCPAAHARPLSGSCC